MKFLQLLSLVFVLGLSTAYAAKSNEAPIVSVNNSPDAAINNLVQQMTAFYSLENAQQIKIKEAAKKMAADAAAQKPLDQKKFNAIKNTFTSAVSESLNAGQLSQFKADLNSKINPLMDAVINAAAK